MPSSPFPGNLPGETPNPRIQAYPVSRVKHSSPVEHPTSVPQGESRVLRIAPMPSILGETLVPSTSPRPRDTNPIAENKIK